MAWGDVTPCLASLFPVIVSVCGDHILVLTKLGKKTKRFRSVARDERDLSPIQH